MAKFEDNAGQSGVMISLANNDDVRFFQMMWSTMNESFKALINSEEIDVWMNPLLHIIIKDGEINKYIKEKHWDKYRDSMIEWL